MVFILQKKVESCDSTAWCRIEQFQTTAQTRYLQMHLLAERFIIFFGIMIVGFFEGVVTTYRMAQMSPLANFFSVFTSIVYGYTVVEWLELWMTYPLVG
jgi:hypothetical protein